MVNLIEPVQEFLKEKFNLYLVAVLLVLGLAVFFSGAGEQLLQEEKFTVHVFYLPTCPHCAEQKPIINELAQEMENVSFLFHDASTPDGIALFYRLAAESGLDTSGLGVPTTFVGKKALVGVHSKEDLIAAIQYCQENCTVGEKTGYQESATAVTEFDLPFFGRTDLLSVSLPVLAITLGLVDGFNPCAMWVLVYLIGLLLNVDDKRKFWLIIGSFVLASGVLYFLFMTAWLNAFLIIGYLRPVTILIGIVALGGGALSLKEYLTAKGALACKIGNEESHSKTESKIQHIISQPLSIGILISIMALAFVVNSVEFACSSAIPAVFTQVLALKDIGAIERYAYILLYDIFFMLDDLIIFGMAGLAISSSVGEKYAKYCKLIGGIIMVALGLMLLFAPQLLR
ncbi:MAG: thioredoxin family protein [Candidatus Bilamarchaeaceae archaeon]